MPADAGEVPGLVGTELIAAVPRRIGAIEPGRHGRLRNGVEGILATDEHR
jgi:hypothetical protein